MAEEWIHGLDMILAGFLCCGLWNDSWLNPSKFFGLIMMYGLFQPTNHP
jgi:hypothetical protein